MFYAESETHTDIDIANEAATEALAVKVAEICGVGDMVALYGYLGVGKTVFARSFIRARAGADEEVPSPTFTLVQLYECDPVPIYHFDLYRLNNPDEILELGFEDAMANGSVLVEWPERLGPYTTPNRLDVEIRQGARTDQRTIRLTGHGYWLARVADVINEGKIHAI
jgi:tRNA threonylcarbamoyladenosine biosynthesis protein TsaE